jgi:hypothetical protein
MTSGSLLVSKNCISLAYTVVTPAFKDVLLLPEPDWDLLNKKRDAGYQSQDSLFQQNATLTESLAQSKNIIHTLQLKEEHANTQLVVQNAHLNKLNQVLHTKENNKKSDCTILFAEGFGRHLTNDESIALIQDQEREGSRGAGAEASSTGGSEGCKGCIRGGMEGDCAKAHGGSPGVEC